MLVLGELLDQRRVRVDTRRRDDGRHVALGAAVRADAARRTRLVVGGVECDAVDAETVRDVVGELAPPAPHERVVQIEEHGVHGREPTGPGPCAQRARGPLSLHDERMDVQDVLVRSLGEAHDRFVENVRDVAIEQALDVGRRLPVHPRHREARGGVERRVPLVRVRVRAQTLGCDGLARGGSATGSTPRRRTSTRSVHGSSERSSGGCDPCGTSRILRSLAAFTGASGSRSPTSSSP